MQDADKDVTRLLIDWSQGDQEALDELLPVVQPELKRLARSFLRREHAGHILQTDALINEAYLRLVDQSRVEWANRAHFFGICARMMRRILVDHARKEKAIKRGGAIPKVTLDEGLAGGPPEDFDILALHEALEHLSELDPRQARVVELRCFAGATVEETGAALGISPATVKREWATAKAWLHREVTAGD
jgi:RNA polymerase sigma factor (TIGR02999 family)